MTDDDLDDVDLPPLGDVVYLGPVGSGADVPGSPMSEPRRMISADLNPKR